MTANPAPRPHHIAASRRACAPPKPLKSEVAARASFDRVRYAQSWEDPAILVQALEPHEGSRIISIAAAGDNTFALLLAGAGHVTSVDMSPAQCSLVELKRAALLALSHEELLRFVGVAPGSDRGGLYARVRRELPIDTRAVWDAQPQLIARGIIHIGKLEHMWRVFRRGVLPLIHGPQTRRDVFDARGREEREAFWHDRWNNHRWKATVRRFFSEPVIARLGRDPSFFEHIDIDPGTHYARRAFHAFVELDPSTNPFLQYMIHGTFLDLDNGHPWLAPGNHTLLCERLERLEVRCVQLEEMLETSDAGGWTGFNLSDVFEWMSEAHHSKVYGAILRASTPGATLAYWNNLVPRSAPREHAHRVHVDSELAHRLHEADRAFLYRAFHVDRVIEGG